MMDLPVELTTGYTIIGQPETTKLNDQGTIEYGRNVTVRDGITNVTFTVFVSNDLYTVQNVQLAIAEKLNEIRAVHMLGR